MPQCTCRILQNKSTLPSNSQKLWGKGIYKKVNFPAVPRTGETITFKGDSNLYKVSNVQISEEEIIVDISHRLNLTPI